MMYTECPEPDHKIPDVARALKAARGLIEAEKTHTETGNTDNSTYVAYLKASNTFLNATPGASTCHRDEFINHVRQALSL